MNGVSVQMIFSPQHCTLKHLWDTLTPDRRDLADRLIAQYAACTEGHPSYNDLIIGPRGTGKTHLLAYVRKTLEARASEGIPKIIALSEEERGVASLLDFLLACLRAAGRSAQDVLERMGHGDPERALETAQDLFREVTDGKPTLIVIENLSEVFKGLGDDGISELRGFLQEHPFASVLASSVSLFSDSSRRDHPFYGHFQIHYLKPLDAKQARTFLALLAQANGDSALAAKLRERHAQPRVKAVFSLTGGNHRLLAMLGNFLTADGFRELVDPFLQMADRELTPYYQQRLDRLSPQQFKILQTIASRDGSALTVNEIARSAFVSPQSASSQLHDLLANGYVERHQRGRESFYDLREPLLRIVLDLKEAPEGPLPLIVKLLRQWYEAEELRALEASVPEPFRAYYGAALGAREVTADLQMPDMRMGGSVEVIRAGTKLLREALTFSDQGDHQRALDTASELVTAEPENAQGWLLKAFALGELGRHEESVAAYDEVVSRFGTSDRPELLEQVARALHNKRVALGQLGRLEEALAACEGVVSRFGSSERPELLEQVAWALHNKGVALGKLGRADEELAACEGVVSRFGSSDRPELVEVVARALVNKGAALGQLGRADEALAACEGVVSRFGSSERPELLEQVARALYNKGVALGQLGRADEELAAYDEVLSRFGSSDRPKLLEQVARALHNKGVALGQLGRADEAVAAYDEVVSQFGGQKREEVRRVVADSFYNKGRALYLSKRYSDALEACEAALRYSLQLPLALALRAALLRAVGRDGDCLEALVTLLSAADSGAEERVLLAADLVGESLSDEDFLRNVVVAFGDDRFSLVNGLIWWLRRKLPISERDAANLEEAERVLRSVFGSMREAKLPLDMLSAARRHAMGDTKALLELPVELRRLLQPEEEKS